MVRLDVAGCLLLLVGLDPSVALADFRLSTPPQSAVVSDVPHVSPGDLTQNRAKTTSTRPSLSIRIIIGHSGPARNAAPADLVEGFGAAVPLAFACRQIVPKSVTVAYGKDVDPETPVNWNGGRPWAAVLRDALRPAGLTLVPHGSVVEIRR